MEARPLPSLGEYVIARREFLLAIGAASFAPIAAANPTPTAALRDKISVTTGSFVRHLSTTAARGVLNTFTMTCANYSAN